MALNELIELKNILLNQLCIFFSCLVGSFELSKMETRLLNSVRNLYYIFSSAVLLRKERARKKRTQQNEEIERTWR